ncbi:MAG: tetratricopeptide repeat protein [Byssovorax sp.]
MSFFDKLFGRKPPKITTPEELRELLFTAAAGDPGAFEQLCRTHREAILTSFPTWTKVPPELRADPSRVQQYANGLIGVARIFAEKLDDSSLFERLSGPPKENPISLWQEQLGEARKLMEALRYKEAAEILTKARETTRGLTGPAVDELLPLTLGFLGECHFHGGEAERALEPFREALRLCEQHQDGEGFLAYHGDLYEVCRYLGDAAGAADHADQLASAFDGEGGDPMQEGIWRTRARIARAGAPQCRAVVLLDERRHELDELPPTLNGRVQIIFERDRISLRPAMELTAQGMKLASKGEYERALTALRAAAAADPYDPQSRYQEGLVLLTLERHAEAVTAYEAVEMRAPGWFHCRADLWLARQIAAGQLDHGAFLAIRSLVDGGLAPAERVRLARQAIVRYPKLPALHLALGDALRALEQGDEASAAYREGLEHAEERDVRTRLLVALGGSLTAGEEQRSWLEEAIALNGNLVAAAMARVILHLSNGRAS